MAKYISTKVVQAAQWDPKDSEPMREFLCEFKNKIRKLTLVKDVGLSKLNTEGCLNADDICLLIESTSSQNAIVAKPTYYVVYSCRGLIAMSATSFESQYRLDDTPEEPEEPEEPTTSELVGLSVADYEDFVIDAGATLTVKVEAERDTTARETAVDKVEFTAVQEEEDTVVELLEKAVCNQLGWAMKVNREDASVSFEAPNVYSKGSAIVAAAKADGTEFFVSEVVPLTVKEDDKSDEKDPDEGEGDLSTPVNKTALTTAIAAANSIAEDANVSEDGSDIDPADQWVTQEDVDTLVDAIVFATTVSNNPDATQEEVNTAVAALNQALVVFGSAKQNGTKENVPASKDALELAVAEAVVAKADVVVSPDGGTVLDTQYWVTQEVMDTLEEAIATAQTIIGDAEATQEEIDAATEAVNDAVKAFVEAKATGRIIDGGEVDLDD